MYIYMYSCLTIYHPIDTQQPQSQKTTNRSTNQTNDTDDKRKHNTTGHVHRPPPAPAAGQHPLQVLLPARGLRLGCVFPPCVLRFRLGVGLFPPLVSFFCGLRVCNGRLCGQAQSSS